MSADPVNISSTNNLFSLPPPIIAGVFFLGLIVRTVMKDDLDSSRASSKSAGASSNNYNNGGSNSHHRSASLALSYGDLTNLLNRKDDDDDKHNNDNHNQDHNNHNHNHNIGTGDSRGETPCPMAPVDTTILYFFEVLHLLTLLYSAPSSYTTYSTLLLTLPLSYPASLLNMRIKNRNREWDRDEWGRRRGC